MIQLPNVCSTREQAERIVKETIKDHSMVISLENTELTAQGFIDELCKQLIALHIDRVILIAANERFMNYFMRAHMLRNAHFMVETR